MLLPMAAIGIGQKVLSSPIAKKLGGIVGGLFKKKHSSSTAVALQPSIVKNDSSVVKNSIAESTQPIIPEIITKTGANPVNGGTAPAGDTVWVKIKKFVSKPVVYISAAAVGALALAYKFYSKKPSSRSKYRK